MNLEHYLEAADDASRRIRNTLIIIVTGCVVMFSALLNSHSPWRRIRLFAMAQNDPYAQGSTSDGQNAESKQDKALLEGARHALAGEMTKSYNDSLSASVPLFDVRFDVNDLDIIGGLAFIATLLMLYYCLRSNESCLRSYIDAVTRDKQLAHGYTVLAIRQVFMLPCPLPSLEVSDSVTIPPRYSLSRLIPRWLIFLPVIAYGSVLIDELRFLPQIPSLWMRLAFSCLGFLIVGSLAVWCFVTWGSTEKLWDSFWLACQHDRREAAGVRG
jgi:hypothetical protein